MALLAEQLTCNMYSVDPADLTVPTDVAWVDMNDYDSILVGVMAAKLTGTGLVASGFKLLGNSAANGSGSDVTLKTHAIGTAADADGDTVWLEITKQEIVALSENGARYVSANVDCANAADELAVTYIRRAKTQKAGNTADYIS